MYSLAREGRLSLPGFPQFNTCTDDLAKLQQLEFPDYSVCVPLPDGGLVIKETLVEYWTKSNPEFEPDFMDLLKDHNSQWNKQNLKRGLPDEGEGTEGQPAKRLKVDSQKSLDHEDQMAERTLCGPTSFMFGNLCMNKILPITSP